MGHAGRVIGLIPDRDARVKINELHGPGFLSDNRQSVGIPFEQLIAAGDFRALFDVQLGAVAQLVAGALFTLLVHDGEGHVTTHHDDFTCRVFQNEGVAEFCNPVMAGFLEGLLTTLGNAADVERPHRQLCTGLTDGLCGDDADSFTKVHLRTPCKVTTITRGANAFFSFTGQRRPHPHRGNTGRLNGVGFTLVDQLTCRHDDLICAGHKHVIRRCPAKNTLTDRGHDFTVVNSRRSSDRLFSTTVGQTHDAILRHVDQTACQVTGVRCFKRRIRQTLTRTVGGVEVLQHGQTFFKVRNNRGLDDVAVRLCHQTAHPAQLFHLCDRATRTGVGHHVNRVRLVLGTVRVATGFRNGGHHGFGDFVVTLRPSIYNFVVLFTLSDQAVHVLLFKVFNLIAGFVHDWPLGVGNHHVVLAERNARLERFAETHSHDLVTEDNRLFLTRITINGVDDPLHVFLPQKLVYQLKRCLGVQGQQRTQTHPTRCGLKALHDLLAIVIDLRNTRLNFGVQVHFASIQSVLHFVHRGEDHAFALHAFALHRDVVEAENHILRRNNDRRAVGGRQNVVRGHHQHACFKLGFQRERHVNSHLVTVEVSVKRGTHERVQLDGLTFDQNGFKRLDAQTVKRRRTVQQNGVFADHLIEDIPHFGTLFFDQFLGLFHGAGQALGL